jgi:hypothetical protein
MNRHFFEKQLEIFGVERYIRRDIQYHQLGDYLPL